MKKLLFISLLATAAFYACTDKNDDIVQTDNIKVPVLLTLTKEEYQSIAFDQISEISEDEIFSMVTDFYNMKLKKGKTRNVSDLKLEIKSKNYLGQNTGQISTRSTNSETGETVPVYEIMVQEGEQGAYAVVSADNRAPGVIAFFDDFTTNPDDMYEALNNPNAKAILALTNNQLVVNVEKVETLRNEMRVNTIEKICKELEMPIEDYAFEKIADKLDVEGAHITRNHEGIKYPEAQVIVEKGPFCKIKWDQYEPYNRSMPAGKVVKWLSMDSGFLVDGNYPVGCVTVACMNIHACLETPYVGGYKINWNWIKTNKDGIEFFVATASQPVRTPEDIYTNVGLALRQMYTDLNSFPLYGNFTDALGVTHTVVSATASYNGESYIRTNFNYTHNQKFDPDITLASLNAEKPIYLSGKVYGDNPGKPGVINWNGEGHAFIIDGYIITQKSSDSTRSINTRANIVQFYDMFWHVNLGWKANSSAYFKLDSDATCTPELTDSYGRYNLAPIADMEMIAGISRK